jgi:hypothetical protein
MKHLLSLIFIIIFNLSAFGQIDTIEWRGKTVLVVVKDDSTSLSTDNKYYSSFDNRLSKDWYLTDSIKSIPRSLLKSKFR